MEVGTEGSQGPVAYAEQNVHIGSDWECPHDADQGQDWSGNPSGRDSYTVPNGCQPVCTNLGARFSDCYTPFSNMNSGSGPVGGSYAAAECLNNPAMIGGNFWLADGEMSLSLNQEFDKNLKVPELQF